MQNDIESYFSISAHCTELFTFLLNEFLLLNGRDFSLYFSSI
jgi:hypothetical protein